MTLTLGSLCSGAGGLDLAAVDVLGPSRAAWVADTDEAAVVVLRERFGVPNLGDISAVDWSTVEPVDVLVAGFPCQDISAAGKRAGIDGDRSGVWRHVATAVGVLRPRLVLLENVSALLVRGGTRVTADLAALGYVGSWRTLRASDVGAPHRRERVFIVAAPADSGREHVRVQPVPVATRVGASVAGSHRPGPGALMPTPTASRGDRRAQPSPELAAARYAEGRRMLDDAVALLPTPTATDAHASRNATASRSSVKPSTNHSEWTLHDIAYVDRWAQYAPAISRWEATLGRPAPDPTIVGKRGGRRLSGRFVEWLMGWPEGWVTDLVDNTAALRLCGNGVVRQQGAAAFTALAVSP